MVLLSHVLLYFLFVGSNPGSVLGDFSYSGTIYWYSLVMVMERSLSTLVEWYHQLVFTTITSPVEKTKGFRFQLIEQLLHLKNTKGISSEKSVAMMIIV